MGLTPPTFTLLWLAACSRPVETRLRWESTEVELIREAGFLCHLEIHSDKGRTRLPDEEQISNLELVEIDGQSPMELRYTSSAGAHGNQVEHFLSLKEGIPVEVLWVSTDEGTLDVKAGPQIVGRLTTYFSVAHPFPDLWDFSRPYVLQKVDGRWQEQTPEVQIRLERAQYQDSLRLCFGGAAVHIYGLSILLKETAILPPSCEIYLPWLTAHDAEIQMFLKMPFFKDLTGTQ